MKILFSLVWATLIVNAGRGSAQTAPAAPIEAPVAPIEARAIFEARMEALREKGDWTTILQNARARQSTDPTDPNAFSDYAHSAFMLGEVEAAIGAWEKLVELHPDQATYADSWLKRARSVRRNFPTLKIQPLQWVTSDAAREQVAWWQKAEILLRAQRFDEIEKLAAQLQKSNSANVRGLPHLNFLFQGLVNNPGIKFEEQRRLLATWRRTRPQSNLARLAAVDMWTRVAWEARGTGTSDTITPAMRARISAALEKGAQGIEALPKSASNSPLFFEVLLDWGQLSGAGRPFLDAAFTQGIRKFPNYLPLYTTRAYQLLPRWFGEAGEWEALIEGRADAIGGEAGDIFYARVVWDLSRLVAISRESDFDYGRAQRGLRFLQARRPASVSVATARLALAYMLPLPPNATQWKDLPTLQQVLSAPQGHQLDDSVWVWSNPKSRVTFAEQRMQILGETKP